MRPTPGIGIALLLLSGCEAVRNTGDDFTG